MKRFRDSAARRQDDEWLKEMLQRMRHARIAGDARISPGKRSLTQQVIEHNARMVRPAHRTVGEAHAAPTGAPIVQAKGPDDGRALDIPVPMQDIAATDGGRPLPDDVRAMMEAMFDADFSEVRIHIGPQAQRIGALAFTRGHHIFFDEGHYQPYTAYGRRLLAHELAHVRQQRRGLVRASAVRGDVLINDDVALEREADDMGARVAEATNRRASPTARRGPPARELDWALGTGYIDESVVQRHAVPEREKAMRDQIIRPQISMINEVAMEVYLFHCAQLILNTVRELGVTEFGLIDLPENDFAIAFANAKYAWDDAMKTLIFRGDTMLGAQAPDIDYRTTLAKCLSLLVDVGAIGESGGGTALNRTYLLMDADLPTPVRHRMDQLKALRDRLHTHLASGVIRKPTKSLDLSSPDWSSQGKTGKKKEQDGRDKLHTVRAELEEYVVVFKEPRGKLRTLRTSSAPVLEQQSTRNGITRWELGDGNSGRKQRFSGEVIATEQISTGTHPKTVAIRKRIQQRIGKLEQTYDKSLTHRSYATQVAAFLRAFRTRCANWAAGNYDGHAWREYSIDFYVKPEEAKTGFFLVDKVVEFFQALHETAVEGVDGQRFEWLALYGDKRVVKALPESVRARVDTTIPGHGPSKDWLIPLEQAKVRSRKGTKVALKGHYGWKDVIERNGVSMVVLAKKSGATHIHVDLRPIDLPREGAGYQKQGERIIPLSRE